MALLPGDSPQIKLVNEWTRGVKELNLDILGKHLHKDFRRFVYPRSIGQAEQNKEEWLELLAVVKNFATTVEVLRLFATQAFFPWLNPLAVDPPFLHRSAREGHSSRLYSNPFRSIPHLLSAYS